MTIFIFDMDGTLTPARQPMTSDFKKQFVPWLKQHNAYVATGSDYGKVEEQIPKEVINLFAGIYCSMGNTLYKKGKQIYQKKMAENKSLMDDLEKFRHDTKYSNQLFECYIEKRIGMVNFSVIGRNCPYEERLKYASWDQQNGERCNIQEVLSKKYPEYDFELGGNISIDIIPKGCGKGQIAHHLRTEYPNEKLVFLGDRTVEGGNDYALASELRKIGNSLVIQVENNDEVIKILSGDMTI